MAWTKGTLFSRKACKQSEREDASKPRTRVNVSQRDRGSNMHLPPSDSYTHTHTDALTRTHRVLSAHTHTHEYWTMMSSNDFHYLPPSAGSVSI